MLSKQIGALMKAKKPDEAAEMKAQVAAIKETLKTQEEKSISLEAERDLKLCQVMAPLPPLLLPAHTRTRARIRVDTPAPRPTYTSQLLLAPHAPSASQRGAEGRGPDRQHRAQRYSVHAERGQFACSIVLQDR